MKTSHIWSQNAWCVRPHRSLTLEVEQGHGEDAALLRGLSWSCVCVSLSLGFAFSIPLTVHFAIRSNFSADGFGTISSSSDGIAAPRHGVMFTAGVVRAFSQLWRKLLHLALRCRNGSQPHHSGTMQLPLSRWTTRVLCWITPFQSPFRNAGIIHADESLQRHVKADSVKSPLLAVLPLSFAPSCFSCALQLKLSPGNNELFCSVRHEMYYL